MWRPREIIIRYQGPDDRAMLNADNPYTRQFASLVRGKPYAFSRLHPVEEGAFLAEDGWLCMAEKGAVTRVMRSEDIRIAGAHNRENFLAAIAAGLGSGADSGYASLCPGIYRDCPPLRAGPRTGRRALDQ